MKNIGFIGAGQMGEAIFSGFLKSCAVSADHIFVSCRTQEKADAVAARYPGVRTMVSADEAGVAQLVDASDIVVIATIPQIADFILPAVNKAADPARHLIISIMGGFTCAKVEESIPETPVICVQPNTPMSVLEGAAAIAGGKNATREQIDEILSLFGHLGTAMEVDERLMDAFTAISGCGPAFCAQFVCGLADGAVAAGLPRQQAIMVAAQTLVGTGKMILESGIHPEILKDNVCSPGGTTIAGSIYLEQQGFRGTAAGAVDALIKRMHRVVEES